MSCSSAGGGAAAAARDVEKSNLDMGEAPGMVLAFGSEHADVCSRHPRGSSPSRLSASATGDVHVCARQPRGSCSPSPDRILAPAGEDADFSSRQFMVGPSRLLTSGSKHAHLFSRQPRGSRSRSHSPDTPASGYADVSAKRPMGSRRPAALIVLTSEHAHVFSRQPRGSRSRSRSRNPDGISVSAIEHADVHSRQPIGHCSGSPGRLLADTRDHEGITSRQPRGSRSRSRSSGRIPAFAKENEQISPRETILSSNSRRSSASASEHAAISSRHPRGSRSRSRSPGSKDAKRKSRSRSPGSKAKMSCASQHEACKEKMMIELSKADAMPPESKMSCASQHEACKEKTMIEFSKADAMPSESKMSCAFQHDACGKKMSIEVSNAGDVSPETKTSLPSQDPACGKKTSIEFSKGEHVHIWSVSLQKWFEDGEIQTVNDDGSLNVKYNKSHPSGKLIPSASIQKMLRKAVPLETSSELGNGIFTNCLVFVSPLGGTAMSTARRRLLEDRVREAGGDVVRTWNKEVTHLVAVPSVTEATLRSEYRGLRRGSRFVAVVTDSWISNSISCGRRLKERDYLWHCTRVPPEEPPRTPDSMQFKPKEEQGSPEAKRAQPAGGELQGLRNAGSPRRKFPFRDGDWMCPKCGQHNFKSRFTCWRKECGCHRPEEADDADASLQVGAIVHAAPNATDSGKSPEQIRDLVVEEFRTCADAWGARGDKWRSWQYKKAEILMRQTRSLARSDLLQAGLTAKFVEKCEEIQREGCFRQAALFRQDANMCTLLELTRLHGVGEKLAHRWLKLGVRSLEDVRARADSLPSSANGQPTGLTHGQRLALQFVDDFHATMSRAEVERLSELVQHHVKSLGIPGPVVSCGSYRSGLERPTSAVIVVNVGEGPVADESERILDALRGCNMLVADLSCGAAVESLSRSGAKPLGSEAPAARVFLGVARGMPAQGEIMRYRRMDLVFCPRVALPFTTLQWTGHDGGIFNRELKRIAAFRGFHLSNTYLCRADREGVQGRNVGNICRTGSCIECEDEEAVFAALDLPYRPPEQRHVDGELLELVAKAAKTVSLTNEVVKAELKAEQSNELWERSLLSSRLSCERRSVSADLHGPSY